VNDIEYDRLTKLKSEIKKIEDILGMFDRADNRYRLRKLFFRKSKPNVAWGHSYGVDIKQFDLDYEDVVAFVDHFEKKLERLKLEFGGKSDLIPQ
jgi:hypothetical protein